MATTNSGHVLPDVLQRALRTVICGTAVGDRSAAMGAYYARSNNCFWSVLHEIGLTPVRLAPAQFENLPSYGIGLTDIIKNSHGTDSQLAIKDYDVPGFEAKMKRYQPEIVAFNGKEAARAFYRLPSTRNVEYGPGPSREGFPGVFVLPSTSGNAKKYWDIELWKEFAFGLSRRVTYEH
jgi:TDG/mug DNA glycosylase family protein